MQAFRSAGKQNVQEQEKLLDDDKLDVTGPELNLPTFPQWENDMKLTTVHRESTPVQTVTLKIKYVGHLG